MDQLHLLPEFISNHLFLTGAFFVVLVLLVKAEYEHQTSRGFQLDPGMAIREMNQNDALVIDVRSDADFARGHIKNAKNMPTDSIKDKLKNLDIDKSNPIVVYCNVGNTSSRSARMLKAEGYTNVKSLKGGITAWQDAKLPLTTR